MNASQPSAKPRPMTRGARRLERADQIDAAQEEPEIDPGVDEHDAGCGREEDELDQQQTPEDLGVADRLKPEQISEPAERDDRRDQQGDHEPEDPGGGEESHKAAHEASARSLMIRRGGAGQSPDPSGQRGIPRGRHRPSTDIGPPSAWCQPRPLQSAASGPRRGRARRPLRVDAKRYCGCLDARPISARMTV
jgi:hypothetical protein